MNNLRLLTDKEIATLTVYGCSAENWRDIQVVNEFTPNFVSNVHFSGKNILGKFEKIFELAGGVKKHSGIFNCHLHNCEVGDNVFIDKIHNYIANISISEGAYLNNVNTILTDGKSTFGNGLKVATMIESGGREVMIYDNLSAPLAYMLAFYRYNFTLTEKIEKAILSYSNKQLSDKGKIGNNVRIENCGSLINVRIGDFARLEGTTSLKNGTVISSETAPVLIGEGVQCNDFIIQSGTSVTEGAMVSNCFIGQGCLIGKQFSAIDSLFFANCQGLHGEAVSIFAGPYTVTHHKSTLMLTALYSFMNAGSGTNFSNHMYKLGPVHQGVTERGVKTSSNSYIMWPARIGAFSVVLGSHKGNPDLSELPFSYLIENDGESTLLPGINLHSAGTIRDVEKWPKRDLRKDKIKIDPICFDFISPYTVSKAVNGIGVLKNLLQNMQESVPYVWYQNCKIKRSALRKGIELYEMAIDVFLANSLKSRLNNELTLSQDDLIKLHTFSTDGEGEWVDMAGLFAPKSAVIKLIDSISIDETDVEFIQDGFINMYESYSEYSWSFAKNIIEQLYEKPMTEMMPDEINLIVEKGEKATKTFNDLILRDAKKEFNSISKTGFGLDGDENEKNLDFIATRGTFEDHPFVKERNK